MEDFNINYYAHHTRFLFCLFKNYDEIDNLGKCQESFERVSKEALLRDFASRAFYTAFLKARDEMCLGDQAMHETVLGQLSHEYKNIFRDLRTFRVAADYKTNNPLTSPLQTEGVRQHYPERLLALMDIFLNASAEQLAYSHVTLEENRARQST